MDELVRLDAEPAQERLGDLSALGDRCRSAQQDSRQRWQDAEVQYSRARQAHRTAIGAVHRARQVRQVRRARCGPIFAMTDIADRVDDAVVLAALIDAVEDYAVCTLDALGAVVTWNIGGYRIKGYAPHEVVGRKYSVFFPDDDVSAGKPQRLLAEATANGRATDEGWRVRKDRSRFWASVIIVALHDSHGSVRGFLEVTRDDTNRHIAERDRRELDELRTQLVRFRILRDALFDKMFAARLSLRWLSTELRDSPLQERVDAAIEDLNETMNDLGVMVLKSQHDHDSRSTDAKHPYRSDGPAPMH